jgi:hypothetical protein
MSPSQVRMALAGLGWGWEDLEKSAKVSRDTLGRFLRGEELKPSTLGVIREALEGAGVEFIDEGQTSASGGAGVRLAKRKTKAKR